VKARPYFLIYYGKLKNYRKGKNMTTNKVILSSEDVLNALIDLFDQIPPHTKFIHFVPTGGNCLAMLAETHGLLNQYRLTRISYDDLFDPKNVLNSTNTIIIDDLLDSGATYKRYSRSLSETIGDVPFYVLFAKANSPIGDKKVFGVLKTFPSNTWLVFPWERQPSDGTGFSGPEDAIIRLIEYIGDDPNRAGLAETPNRIVRSFQELYSGYHMDPIAMLKEFAMDEDDKYIMENLDGGLILMKDIEFYSMCEHHMLPFYGKAHVAYIPNEETGLVVGASKLARVLDVFARRLQIQERIGRQVVSCLQTALKAQGAACIIEARHHCMCSRGVQKQGSIMVTSSMSEKFMSNSKARNELMLLIRG
jgi:GTP cyclohydrolase I